MKVSTLKLIYRPWAQLVLVFLLLVAGALSPRLTAAAPLHMGMHDGMSVQPTECRAYCSNNVAVATNPTKTDSDEQETQPRPVIPEYRVQWNFDYPAIRRIANVIEPRRVIRPPDRCALQCAFRF